MDGADFLVIGGGVAGLSAAARLARHGRVLVLEAEDALGYHSSGRSVSFSHYGIGGVTVRALTAMSRPFFESPPEGFSSAPISRIFPTLYFADDASLVSLEALRADMAPFTDSIRPVGEARMARLCPVLRTGPGAALRGLLDSTGLKLDADAMLQSFARAVRGAGSGIRTGQRVAAIERRGENWRVSTEAGLSFAAPILVDSAGAWADAVAAVAGVPPLGLQPMRRTIIAVDPPANVDIRGWPFVLSAARDFYMLPEAGRILASPVDEAPDQPCDAQPEAWDVALAAERLEHHTHIAVRRIAHRWAGLRTFTPDRIPTAGFAPEAPGFFWLAGQGGYGFQTAPAMAEAAESLICGTRWPEGLAGLGVGPEALAPRRGMR